MDKICIFDLIILCISIFAASFDGAYSGNLVKLDTCVLSTSLEVSQGIAGIDPRLPPLKKKSEHQHSDRRSIEILHPLGQGRILGRIIGAKAPGPPQTEGTHNRDFGKISFKFRQVSPSST